MSERNNRIKNNLGNILHLRPIEVKNFAIDLNRLLAEYDLLKATVIEYENASAICPEDIGFVEYIEKLKGEKDKLKSALEEFVKFTQNCDWSNEATVGLTIDLGIKAKQTLTDLCSHHWVSAKNEIIQNGEYCTKCGALRTLEEIK